MGLFTLGEAHGSIIIAFSAILLCRRNRSTAKDTVIRKSKSILLHLRDKFFFHFFSIIESVTFIRLASYSREILIGLREKKEATRSLNRCSIVRPIASPHAI